MDLSVIIPVFKGEKTLEELTDRIIAVFNGNLQFEIIMVFDNGTSGAWKKITSLVEQKPDMMKGIKLNKNYGQHQALLCGFQYSGGDLVATLDEDMQNAPEELIKLVQKQKNTQADLVYGIPVKYNQPFFRKISSKIVHFLLKLTVRGLKRKFSSFRLIKGKLARSISQKAFRYVFIDGILGRESNKIVQISVEHNKRFEGKSSWNVRRLFDHITSICIYYSIMPVFCIITGILLIGTISGICIAKVLYSLWMLIILLAGVIFLLTGIIFLIMKSTKSCDNINSCVIEII